VQLSPDLVEEMSVDGNAANAARLVGHDGSRHPLFLMRAATEERRSTLWVSALSDQRIPSDRAELLQLLRLIGHRL
jgi:hypothetical protein